MVKNVTSQAYLGLGEYFNDLVVILDLLKHVPVAFGVRFELAECRERLSRRGDELARILRGVQLLKFVSLEKHSAWFAP